MFKLKTFLTKAKRQELTYLVIITLSALFYGCEPVVTFNEPQPAGVDDLPAFPVRLQGNYLSLADSSTLMISDKLMQRQYDVYYKTHRNKLDSNEILIGDTLINVKTKEKNIILFDGDSIINHLRYTDTLILLDADNVVRKWKGYYFINSRYNGDSWEVRKIKLSGGKLIISSIASKAALDELQEMTSSEQDTIAPYTFSVNRQQFSKFVQHNGFSDDEVFVQWKSDNH
ncbi:MAG: hypothetical protein K1X61_13575 [Chitinophagales bacterium]|nr:hypothetical protein [Chitinophagales bacterium]